MKGIEEVMKKLKVVVLHCMNFIANCIHLVMLCGLGLLVFKAIIPIENKSDLTSMISAIGINEIFTFIGAIAFILFGIIGIYEYAYANGVGFLVPPTFKYFKQKNDLKHVEKMMQVYYEQDIRYIQEYEKERTDFFLQALGIEEKQYNYINYQIIKARTKPDRCIYDLNCKIRDTLFHKEFIINQSEIECSRRVYDKVDYFLNLYTAIYDETLCNTIASIMTRYLVLSLEEKIAEVDYIIIPEGSNFLLGLEVGKQLHKPIISILHKPRIVKDIFWDGIYNEKKRNNIIVLHDVLVTGQRIYDSIEKLPPDTYNLLGIFSLFKYNNKEYNPIKDFAGHGIEKKMVNWLCEIDEDILKKIYEGSYETDNI